MNTITKEKEEKTSLEFLEKNGWVRVSGFAGEIILAKGDKRCFYSPKENRAYGEFDIKDKMPK